jgi:acetyltransferase-like isoleucine patch superfamily enzyme
VVRGDVPDYAIAVGAPAKVVRDRLTDYEAEAARRAAIADMSRKADAALRKSLNQPG